MAVNVYGWVHHYDLLQADGQLRCVAVPEWIRSAADRSGKLRLAERRQGRDRCSSLGGAIWYVDVLAIDGAVRTLDTRGRHVVVHTSERFSGLE